MTMDDVPSTLTPAKTAEVLVASAVYKHNTRYESTFLKAFSAGIMISFGALLSLVFTGGATALNQSNPGIVKVLGGFIFPVGLVMIMIQGLELLTSNMMSFPMAVASGALPWWSLPLNWFIVTFGNLSGCLFTAAILVHYTGVVSSEPYLSTIKAFTIHKAGDPQWHQIFLRGIGCNCLVCVGFWQAAGARETISKIIAIWLPVWTFVACSYDHVVANMFYIPCGIILGADLTTAEYIRKSFIATFAGNIIGGLLIALPATYHYLRDPSRPILNTHFHFNRSQSSGAVSVREDDRDVKDIV